MFTVILILLGVAAFGALTIYLSQPGADADKIVAPLTKIVSKLEALAEAKRAEAASAITKIADLHSIKDAAETEIEKAKALAENVKKLVS